MDKKSKQPIVYIIVILLLLLLSAVLFFKGKTDAGQKESEIQEYVDQLKDQSEQLESAQAEAEELGEKLAQAEVELKENAELSESKESELAAQKEINESLESELAAEKEKNAAAEPEKTEAEAEEKGETTVEKSDADEKLAEISHEELQEMVVQKESELVVQIEVVEQKESELAEQKAVVEQKESELALQQEVSAQQESELAEQKALVEQQESELEEQKEVVEQKESELEEQIELSAQKEAEYQEKVKKLQVELDHIAGVRQKIIKQLKEKFAGTELDIAVDSESGIISMDSNVLFELGSSELTKEGRNLLAQFFADYCDVLFDDEVKDYVSELIIEGHTDESGPYLFNLFLSQRRALSVAEFCLADTSSLLSDEELELVRSMLTVNGRSYYEPILDDKGEVDDEASRRVEVQFRLLSDDMLKELVY